VTAASTSHIAEAANPSRSPVRRGFSQLVKSDILPDDFSSKVVVTDDMNDLCSGFYRSRVWGRHLFRIGSRR
jgi:hypothetical protein